MEVIINGARSTSDAWDRARSAPVNELPTLSPEEEKDAARYGTPLEKYARRLYAEELSREELGKKAVKIARLVERMVKEHQPDASLYRVVMETLRGLLRLFLNVGGQDVEIDVDEDLVDELMRTGSKELLDRLLRVVRLSMPAIDGESLAS